MNLYQILLSIYFAFLGAYLSIVLSRLLRQNGSAIRELGEKMDKGFNLIAELIKETREETKALILSKE